MTEVTGQARQVVVPEPSLDVVDAKLDKAAAVPTLTFKARMNEPTGLSVYMIALSCQVHIDPSRRRYETHEMDRLVELFGEPQRWGATTRAFFWQRVDVLVHGFTNETSFDIPLLCTFDTELAAAKYFYSLDDGVIPLTFHPSGSIYYQNETGGLQIIQFSWACEARFMLPVQTWKDLRDYHFPNSAWLRVSSETLESLHRRRIERGQTSFDATISELLEDR